MSRPPDRSRDKPRRPFRERQSDRGDREAPRTEGPRTGSDRPGRPWREKRADDERKSGSDAGRGPRRPWQKDRSEDRGPGRKEHGERPNRDHRDARPERASDGPRPERRQPWKRRPEAEGQDHNQDRERRGDRQDRDHRGPRPERTSGAPRPNRRQHWKRNAEPVDEDRILIWGIHAVEAALRNPKREVKRLLLTDNAAHRLEETLRSRPLTPQEVAPRDLDRELGNDTVHQGALLETSPLDEPSIDEVLASSPNPLIVALDQVTDPHNAGAILRSAAAFGVAAVIMTRRHSPPSSGALAKSASGALELVPVLHVPNLAQALGELGEKHVLRLGLDGDAPDALEDVVTASAAPAGPIALVLGAEERGLRRLSKDLCDRLVRLTTPGALASLNVSNAAAIAMHHIVLARRPL